MLVLDMDAYAEKYGNQHTQEQAPGYVGSAKYGLYAGLIPNTTYTSPL
jgi:hypothetical protein